MSSSPSRSPVILGVLGVACLIGGLAVYLSQSARRESSPPPVSTAGPQVDLTQPLPFDTAITTGTLRNGLRYVVRANRQPEHRAELRLVVKAGSLVEDDDQRGLAHFVEHMAFNGTTRFPKHQIVAFLESVGMRFGPGINASTGYDETVYRLVVPTDQSGVLEQALAMLQDMAQNVAFDTAEIDRERPVVIEEWRARRGLGARMQDARLPALLPGSRYLDRQPIGTPESIQTFKPERLKQFYADWYRPDLMAVVAVGDFDQTTVAHLVSRQFAAIPARADKRPLPVVSVPRPSGTSFVITADREATGQAVSIAYPEAASEAANVGEYRRDTVVRLAAEMMSQRLTEVAQRPNGPLVSAGLSRNTLVRGVRVTTLAGAARDNTLEAGLRELAVEQARLVAHGFTAPELERQKATVLRGFERAVAEKDRQPSPALAAEYVRHVTTGEPVPGLQWESDVTTRLLPGISVDDVSAAAKAWFSAGGSLVAVVMPDRAGRAPLTEATLRKALADAAGAPLTPWVTRVTAASLLETPPEPGSVVAVATRAGIGVTEWTLSNGARVVLLPTTFQQDQIVFRAVSPGGLSLARDADLIPAQTAMAVVSSMGFGRFASGDLRRWLTGRPVTVQASIGPFDESLSGSSSRQELETMFQLIHLTVADPRRDPVIFNAVRSQMSDSLDNQGASPEAAFGRVLADTMAQNHARARPLTVESLGGMDMDKSLSFYRQRFGDASDFTFVFAGSFDLETMRPLVERYLASLPATRRGESWKDTGVRPPRGVVERVVERGREPKSRTALIFTGSIESDRLRAVEVVALADVLQARLREALREELGGTYGVEVGGLAGRVPVGQYTLSIDFTSDPARADALTARVFAEIAKLKQAGPSAQQVNDVRTALLRDFQTNSRQNPYLVGQLAQRYQSGETPESLWQMPEVYKRLTPALLKGAAQTFLDDTNYVKVTLRPEK